MFDQAIVGLYLLLTLGIGLYTGQQVKTVEAYQGYRRYSAWVIFASLSASYIGGGFTIGLAEKTYMYGLIFILAIWGFSAKELLVARYLAPRVYAFPTALTTGDIMRQAYGPRAQWITGIASICVCSGILGAQMAACGNILEILMGMPAAWGSFLTACFMIVYAALGGLNTVIIIDIIHFGLLIGMLPLVGWFTWRAAGGMQGLSALPALQLSWTGGFSPSTVIILFGSFFLGETLIPPYVQRLLIGRDERATQRGTWWSGILSIPFFLLVGLIGMLAAVCAPNITPSLALPFMIKTVLPIGIKGLAMAAMLAVVMSSADSFLNCTAISLTHDVFKQTSFGREWMKHYPLTISRWATASIGLFSLLIALTGTSVLDILLYSYQFWTPCILLPLIAAFLGLRANDRLFCISAIAGLLAILIWNWWQPWSIGVPGALEGVIFGVLMNSVVFAAGYLLLAKQKDALL